MKGVLRERPSSFCRYSLGIREVACSCQFGRFIEIRFDDPNPAQGHQHRDLLGQLVNSYRGIADPLCIATLRVPSGTARVVGDAVYQRYYVRLGVRRTKCTAESAAQPMV